MHTRFSKILFLFITNLVIANLTQAQSSIPTSMPSTPELSSNTDNPSPYADEDDDDDDDEVPDHDDNLSSAPSV